MLKRSVQLISDQGRDIMRTNGIMHSPSSVVRYLSPDAHLERILSAGGVPQYGDPVEMTFGRGILSAILSWRRAEKDRNYINHSGSLTSGCVCDR
jgi:hypothetical protein